MLEVMIPPVGDGSGTPAPELTTSEEVQTRARWLDSMDPAAGESLLDLPLAELELLFAAWLDPPDAAGDDPAE